MASTHDPQGMLSDITKRLMIVERRKPISGGSSAFVLPDRLGPTGAVAADLNTSIENGSYRGASPANAPITTTLAGWNVIRGGAAGASIRQEFYRLAAGDTRVWIRTSADSGATWSAWLLVGGSLQQAPVDLSAYVVSGGTLFGIQDGRHRELYGSGHAAATTTSATPAWNALPVEWRPLANKWGVGYSAAWPVNAVQRPDGTGGFANRVSGTNLTTVQFSIPYMV